MLTFCLIVAVLWLAACGAQSLVEAQRANHSAVSAWYVVAALGLFGVVLGLLLAVSVVNGGTFP